MQITGTTIADFYKCPKEEQIKDKSPKYKGGKWGVECQQLYRKYLESKGKSIEQIVQDHLCTKYIETPLNEIEDLRDGLVRLITAMERSSGCNIYKSSLIVKEDDISVQIDFLMQNQRGMEFIREFKSYKSAFGFAYNSDMIQLATQCYVWGRHWELDIDFGEIAYLGCGSLCEILVKSLYPAVLGAKEHLLKGQKICSCSDCRRYNLPCYTHLRRPS